MGPLTISVQHSRLSSQFVNAIQDEDYEQQKLGGPKCPLFVAPVQQRFLLLKTYYMFLVIPFDRGRIQSNFHNQSTLEDVAQNGLIS